jgi:hypothetical protein
MRLGEFFDNLIPEILRNSGAVVFNGKMDQTLVPHDGNFYPLPFGVKFLGVGWLVACRNSRFRAG